MKRLFLSASLLLLVLCLSQTGFTAMEIIAHRGYSSIAPENTLAAMKAAWNDKYDGVECDIYLTKDHQVVLSHDASTLRTSGVNYEIASTNSKVLETLDVGSFKSPEFKGEKLPFLADILKEMPDNSRIFIEIKCGPEITPYLKKVVKSSKKQAQVAFISFRKDSLIAAKKAIPSIPVYYLLGHSKDSVTKQELPYDDSIIQLAKDNHFDGLDLAYPGMSESLVKNIHAAGLKAYVWTLDKPVEAVAQAKMGIDGITTNQPGLLRDTLRKNNLYPEN